MCFKGYWFLQHSVFLHRSAVVWKGAAGLILPQVWVQDWYSQGFPKGLWGRMLKRAIHSLFWGWEKLNLTVTCRNPSHKLEFHLRKGPLGCAGVVSHLLLPYLLDASSCPPLPHCVPQPSGCIAVAANSPFPVSQSPLPHPFLSHPCPLLWPHSR